jgi:hypothetical protein
MPATGYTPILLYGSANAGATPAAANLTNGTGGSEIAINITDGRLYYKDDNGAVQLIGAKLNSVLAAALASAPVGTGNVVLSSSAIVSAGAATYSSDTTLTAANAGQIIFFTGSAASTFTLPASASAPPYAMKLTISNQGSVPLTITPAAGDGYDLSVPVLQPSQQAIVANDGGTYWHVIAQTNGTTFPFAVGAAQTATQAVNLGQTIGNGATAYANVTASRALDTAYTNNTSRPLVVCVEVNTANTTKTDAAATILLGLSNGSAVSGAYSSASVAGNIYPPDGGGYYSYSGSVTFIVPPGGLYMAHVNPVILNNTSTSFFWFEY